MMEVFLTLTLGRRPLNILVFVSITDEFILQLDTWAHTMHLWT